MRLPVSVSMKKYSRAPEAFSSNNSYSTSSCPEKMQDEVQMIRDNAMAYHWYARLESIYGLYFRCLTLRPDLTSPCMFHVHEGVLFCID